MMRFSICAAAAAAALLTGCADDDPPIGDDGGDDGGDDAPALDYQVASLVPPITNPLIDVLFVVDNSGSMQEENSTIAARVRSALADVIGAALGEPPDLHIGVITSDMGVLGGTTPDVACSTSDDGELRRPDACTQLTANYLADAGDGAVVNYTGTLEDALACITPAGSDWGCGFEQPFNAVIASLDHADNAGFFRADAQLVVIFLTDEDDCSATGPDLYTSDDPVLGPIDSFRCFHEAITCVEGVDTVGVKTGCEVRHDNPLMRPLEDLAAALIAFKGNDATKVMVSSIAGIYDDMHIELGLYTPVGAEESRLDLIPTCSYVDDFGVINYADPALRMEWMVDRFAGLSWSDMICGPVDEPLARTAEAVGDVVGRRACLRGALRDADAAAAGLQPTCRSFLVTDPLTAAEARTPVPTCDATTTTGCAAVIADASCDHWHGLGVELRGVAPTAGQSLVTECVR
jgi:hypothetical protein